MGAVDEGGPWHIVNRVDGKHAGPFTTELDCVMARSIGRPSWANAIDMDAATFERHLAAGSAR